MHIRALKSQTSPKLKKIKTQHVQVSFPCELSVTKVYSYVGVDPTAEKIHLGNYLQIVTNARAALHGIDQIYLVGGATGRIGDPSGKSSERNFLGDETVDRFSDSMESKLKPILSNLYGYLERHHQGINIGDFLNP